MLASSVVDWLLAIFVVVPVLIFIVKAGLRLGFTERQREEIRNEELRKIREQGERKP